MFLSLQHLMPPRRTGRIRRATMAAIDTVRGGTGYGDRPVHDHLSTRLPGDRKAEVEHAFSALDQSGLHLSLIHISEPTRPY